MLKSQIGNKRSADVETVFVKLQPRSGGMRKPGTAVPGKPKKDLSESRKGRHPLIIRWNLHKFFLDRPHHQLCLVVNPQLSHEIELMSIHRLDA